MSEIPREILSDETYRDALEDLERAVRQRIPNTGLAPWQEVREADFYQIEHGSGHIGRVRGNMVTLLTASTRAEHTRGENPLEKQDVFTALAAASLHDIGMHFGWSVYDRNLCEPLTPQKAETVRKRHGEIGAAWLRNAVLSPQLEKLELGVRQETLEILADTGLLHKLTFIIAGHDLRWDKLEKKLENEFPDPDLYKKVKCLTCILRIADAADMDRRRVPTKRMKLAEQYFLKNIGEIRPRLTDIIRYFMVHYVHAYSLTTPRDKNFVEFTLDLRVPTRMLAEAAYRPLLAYFRDKYKARLDGNYERKAVRDFAGIKFIDIDVPEFKSEPTQHCLAPELLPPILTAVQIKQQAGLTLSVGLREWVSTRWVSAKGIPAHPNLTWEDFAQNRVELDPEALQKIEQILEEQSAALVEGLPACGKSVFAVELARQWQQRTQGLGLWLDLREMDSVEKWQLMSAAESFLGLEIEHKLLVVDNVHLDTGFLNRFIDRLDNAPSFPGKVLFLARRLDTSPFGRQGNLAGRLENQTVVLETNGSALKRVAQLLAARHGKEIPWQKADYQAWAHEFGNDLMAFAYAALHALTHDPVSWPSMEGASHYIRQKYLDPAQQSPTGAEPFLRLCALATLDMEADDGALGGSFATLYPGLYKDGLATEQQVGSYRRWAFYHPRLAEIIISIAAHDTAQYFGQLRISRLLEAAQNYPYILPDITFRMANEGYAQADELREWQGFLKANPALILKALVVNPLGMMLALKRGLLFWQNLAWLEVPHFSRLVMRLAQIQPHFVAFFLRGIAALKVKDREGNDRAGEELAADILDAVLEGDGYYQKLRQSPPHFVADFLRWVAALKGNDRAGKELAADILDAVLEGDGYYQKLRQSPPGDLVPFLRWVAALKVKDREGNDRAGKELAADILDAVLEGDGYYQKLRQSPPHFVASFLRWVAALKVKDREGNDRAGEELAADILDAVLEGDGYYQKLRQSPPGDLVPFLRWVAALKGKDREGNDRAGEELAADILDAVLEGDGYYQKLRQSPPHFVADFLRWVAALKVKDREGNDRVGEELAADILDAVLEGDGYYQKLRQSPPGDLASFLRWVAALKVKDREGNDRVGEELAADILDAVLEGDGYYQKLRQSPPHFVASFLRWVAALKVKDREGNERAGKELAADILDAVLEGDGYYQKLRQSPPHFVASFLRWVAALKVKDREGNDRAGEELAADILDAVLEGDGYYQKLRQSHLNTLGQFLKLEARLHGKEKAQQRLNEYWGQPPKQKLQKAAEKLPYFAKKLFVDNLQRDGLHLPPTHLRALLGSSAGINYLESVRSTGSQTVEEILGYFASDRHQADELAGKVVASGDQLDLLRRSPVQFGLILLGHLLETRQEEKYDRLVAYLLTSPVFHQAALQAPLDIQAEFYRHLTYCYGGPLVQGLLAESWAGLEPDAFRSRLHQEPSALAGQFRQALVDAGLWLPEDLWNILTTFDG